jgi:ubiquinol-cytochrome c reductase iron-sulfur subunit
MSAIDATLGPAGGPGGPAGPDGGMQQAGPEGARRQWLIAATGAVGGVGLLATAWPFVDSMELSARALAVGGPVVVDVSDLAPGQLRTVPWRGKPVWVMRRTPEMVRALQQPNPGLADPLSKASEQPPACANATRSERPDLFVAVGVCTHLGCTPVLRLDDPAISAELHAPGGFLCPCHGSRFDLAGRVVKNVPAPTNLEIPEYRFQSDTSVQIG